MIFEAILYFLVFYRLLGYIIVFFGMIVEGDIILFTAAFLTYNGFFDPVYMFLVVFSGVIIGDIGWYYLGVYCTKFPRINHWLDRITSRIDKHLAKWPLRTLFLSKFVYGLHHPVLMRAGSQRLGLRKYIQSDIIASLVWIFIISGLGFLVGTYFLVVKRYIHYAELGFLLCVVIFFVLERFLVAKQLKDKI